MIVALIICVSLGCACGLLKENKISNEQIDADIGNQALKVTEGSPNVWDFKKDNGRCFNISESKYAEGKAEVTVRLASFYDANFDVKFEDLPEEKHIVETALGEIVLNYKSEGDKWVFEKAESKKLLAKSISNNDFRNTFLPLQFKLCENYEHKDK